MRTNTVIEINVQADGPATPLPHMWSVCVGAGRANEGLRANWQAQLRDSVKSCGFKYLRFHGLFHDDMFVYSEDSQGKAVYKFQYIDALFDAMLEMGIRPFVELGFSPRAMATQPETGMWWKMHGTPPKDLAKWGALVTAFTRHCIARYGLEEVRSWYFEVWNEPNLHDPERKHGFFTGSRSEYYELYQVTVLAVKAVDMSLRVGGPATSNFVCDGRFDGEDEVQKIGVASLSGANPDSLPWHPVWVEHFLNWCVARNLPVDFISTHPYPTDFAFDGHGGSMGFSREKEATIKDLQFLRTLGSRSGRPDAEIHCTEWSSSPSSRDHTHDFPQAATYVVMTNLKAAGLANSLSYWVFTDVFEEEGAGNTIWHGGFGMVNFQGIPKPVYHAYRFLNRLGEQTLAQGEGYTVTRRRDGGVAALLYHYPPEVPVSVPITKTVNEAWHTLRQGHPATFCLCLKGLKPMQTVTIHTLDAEHGWGRGEWEKAGSPEPPTREQTAALIQAAQPAVSHGQSDAKGTLDLALELAPWAVVLVEVLEEAGNEGDRSRTLKSVAG